MKKMGVARYVTPELTIELHASAFTMFVSNTTTDIKKALSLPPSQEELCRCGHEFTAHNECGCLLGCPVSKCAPPE
jgi:hypothetical protein